MSPWHRDGRIKRLYAERADRVGLKKYNSVGIDKQTCYQYNIRPKNLELKYG